MKSQKFFPILSVISYVFAIFFAIYGVWTFLWVNNAISDAIFYGQIVAGENVYEIASLYITNSFRYFVYTLLLLGAGVIFRTHSLSQGLDNNTENAGEMEAEERD
ncbi:MAG: hypothetical protein FWG65_04130 [Turicibacter sp.]|nr:hypothetical protein [Turicibacter sp.]